MHYKRLQWDTNFFNIDIAEIRNSGFFNVANLAQLIDELKEEKVKLIYLYIDPRDIAANKYAASKKWFLADEKITYTLQVAPSDNKSLHDDIMAYRFDYLNNELISLAIQSGEWSRFKIDNKFRPDDFTRLYKKLIENSVKGDMADEIFVHKTGEHIDGMITIAIKENIGIIGLLGVDVAIRGNGVGKNLINSAIDYCSVRKIERLNVVTQKKNTNACKFYEKNNFKINSIINLYHVWL